MDSEDRAIAIVGIGATLPDAPDAATFWSNVRAGRYSISDVDPERWEPARYYDADPRAPDKTYSMIGGWVREWSWDPFAWKLPIPPTVTERMDIAQRWAISCTRAALADYGYPGRPLDTERTAVILGNAMGGELHYLTALKIFFPEFGKSLESAPSFAALPVELREAIESEAHRGLSAACPDITEDSMPGELANCIAGRIANLFNLHGSNYVVDAACASAMAAMSAAVEGLIRGDFDAVLSGGIDRNMGASTFVKFCKIGALSATGTRPYADGADGFVMGEGAVVFLLKRLADAERAGDRVYAVLRGLGGSSDGRGKGITAPNPVGQKLAIRRGWENAGLSPATAGFVEGHGTSTKVGDVVEVESLTEVFSAAGAKPGTVYLGSVKSNIGHLKGAAGAAGLLKATLALHEKVIPPSLNCDRLNPNIDFTHSPFVVNTVIEEWKSNNGDPRRAGVSAFGFGGSNFHAVLEEHVPGMIGSRRTFAGADFVTPSVPSGDAGTMARSGGNGGSGGPAVKAPPGGIAFTGAATVEALKSQLADLQREARAGRVPARQAPLESELKSAERVAIDFTNAADLAQKAGKAVAALDSEQAKRWSVLASQGVFRGRGEAPPVAFLYTGQGSQYVNMLADLRHDEPIIAAVFDEADRVMEPLIGRLLTDHIFVDPSDAKAMAAAEESLRQTTITQPAVLSVDTALTRLLAEYGVEPDMVMGHSLGEYGALVAAGALDFAHALEAVSARGREMTRVSTGDNGAMAAVSAPIALVEEVLAGIDGYVVIANINSTTQAVIGGEADAVGKAVAALEERDVRCVPLTVSHAFHTRIVAPASEGLSKVLRRLGPHTPRIPVVSNVTGEFYPGGPSAINEMIELLGRQVASPVQFVKGLETLFDAGARVFVEVGPRRALTGFTQDVLGDRPGVLPLFTNHPRLGDAGSVTRCLAGLWAAGLGRGRVEPQARPRVVPTNGATRSVDAAAPVAPAVPVDAWQPPVPAVAAAASSASAVDSAVPSQTFLEAARILADFLGRGLQDVARAEPETASSPSSPAVAPQSETRVVVTGVGVGLPGARRVFDDTNLDRILRGDVMISAIPAPARDRMAGMRVTRLVKPANDDPRFERIDDVADVIKLAGRGGEFDLSAEFGIKPERVEAFDACTRLAIAAGIDALRDAGIPLVRNYRTTTVGTQLPEGWRLPEALRDDTGIIFASAFPGIDPLINDVERYHEDLAIRQRLADLENLRTTLTNGRTDPTTVAEIDRRIAALRADLEQHRFAFNHRFLFRVLSMGHSQFAEEIGARGPNTQVNSACATTTLALGVAEDWIRTGRCRRVIVIAGDDITRDGIVEWFGAAFLASGAAATDERVEDAALPFDRRRHGLIMGMGGAALVLEDSRDAAQRGIRPICEVLGTVSANSAFHGSRLDIDHISRVMERLVSDVERRWGIRRDQLASETVFVSHETYTPARGGSASAEVYALRNVFGPNADRIVIANTKGYTGHAMAVGIEDVIAVRMLETGIVPPVPNLREIDPELGNLNLSAGGPHPVRFALRLGAGFGSQIAMALLAWTPPPDGRRVPTDQLGFRYRVTDPAAFQAWLARMSGYAAPELEIDHHRLRVRDHGPPARVEQTYGTGTPAVASTPVVPPPAVVAVGSTPSLVAAATPSTMPVPAPAASDPDPIPVEVLRIVSEQTGYPPDMLDMDLDLEADLGIDTVKQAETFAAIRGRWDIPRDEHLKLRDYPTLNHVVQFVIERSPSAAAQAPTAAVRSAGQASASSASTGSMTVAEPVAASASGPPPDGAAGPDVIALEVLRIVSEQTGYPSDMLDMDLDLEADLGIDTVKQAETFAAIRGRWDIPRDENLKLRDYPTLSRVVQFVRERLPAAEPASPPAVSPADGSSPAESSPAEASPAAPSAPAITGSMDAANAVPRRVPRPVLRPSLDLCRPTGVRLDEGERVLVMMDAGGVGAALVERLARVGVESIVVESTVEADELEAIIDSSIEKSPIRGVYWLPALDAEPEMRDMELADWREGLRRRVKLLYTAMRRLYEPMKGPGTFLVAATRLGGLHGYDDAGAQSPMGGAVSGFVKAYFRERPAVLSKVVDFESSRKPAALVDILIDETLRDPGAVEIGIRDGRRYTIGLRELPPGDGTGGLTLDANSVYAITGAAGSIVSAIVSDLAVHGSGGTFHLLDLAGEPDPADPDLARFHTDRDGLRRDIFERMKGEGKRATPALVEKELSRLERADAALTAIRAVRAAGGTAHWHSVDLRDGDAVRAAIDRVRDTSGRIDLFVHAAGLEISRFLPEKAAAEYDLVFDVKADGWFNVMKAAGDMPIGTAVAFSSIAGRFGNGGQTDYSAANDLLCKCASGLRAHRPGTRGLAIDWTAWGGIGMASRGSIPRMMEVAGIDMLLPEAGIPVVRREVTSSPDGSEVVIANSLGIMLDEIDETGGIDAEAMNKWSHGPMIGQVVRIGVHEGLIVETELDPTVQPFLDDHRIDGTAVLPGVMGVEAFAELAMLPLPGHRVEAIEDVRFLAPFKFYRDEPRTVRLEAVFEPTAGGIVADCRLIGSRVFPGRDRPQVTTHFAARVRLAEGEAEPVGVERTPVPVGSPGEATTADDIYRVYFHGPAYRVLHSAWRDNGAVIGRMNDELPSNHEPVDLPLACVPRHVELCFQAAGLHGVAADGALGLPLSVARLRVFGQPEGPCVAVVRPREEGYDADVIRSDGTLCVRIEDYRTIALPGAAAGEAVEAIRAGLEAARV